MSDRIPVADHDLPVTWWGPVWSPRETRSLSELVAGGMLSERQAELLRHLVAAGRSLTIAASPSRAGKTTLLTALLDDLPPNRSRVFVRGAYDADPLRGIAPISSALLVNEISPHLPIYSWGSALRVVLEAGRAGAQILSTIHADSPEELVYQLASYPLRLPPDLIATLDVVAFLGVTEDANGRHRRVREIVELHASIHGQEVVVGSVLPETNPASSPA